MITTPCKQIPADLRPLLCVLYSRIATTGGKRKCGSARDRLNPSRTTYAIRQSTAHVLRFWASHLPPIQLEDEYPRKTLCREHLLFMRVLFLPVETFYHASLLIRSVTKPRSGCGDTPHLSTALFQSLGFFLSFHTAFQPLPTRLHQQ